MNYAVYVEAGYPIGSGPVGSDLQGDCQRTDGTKRHALEPQEKREYPQLTRPFEVGAMGLYVEPLPRAMLGARCRLIYQI